MEQAPDETMRKWECTVSAKGKAEKEQMHSPYAPKVFPGKIICLQCGRPGFYPWVKKIPWRRERLPTPVFWPGEFNFFDNNKCIITDYNPILVPLSLLLKTLPL